MNAPKHRVDDVGEATINRVVPMTYLFAIIGAGGIAAGSIAVTVQNLAKEVERSGERTAAQIQKLREDATAGSISLKGYEYDIRDLQKRVTMLEARK